MQNRASIVAVCLLIAIAGCSSSSATPTLQGTTPTPNPTTPPSPTPVLTATRQTGHIQVGSLTRDYLVVTPPNIADRDSLPLLLALHGWTQLMSDAERISGYDSMALDPGAVVVYPQGYGDSWNAGACCEPANTDGVDDVGFLRALIDRMEGDYPIDPNRVFVVGGSNGGEMAERAACELSERIAAIADVIGTLLVDCNPSQPVSVIAIHGTADDRTPIDGGPTGCQDAPCPAFLDVMARWRQIDGCTSDPAITTEGTVETTTYSSCADGTEVTFITVDGGTHDWYPSNPDDRAVTWDFFMSHPRTG
jgi:polyhydroxybutyrate depolymerase